MENSCVKLVSLTFLSVVTALTLLSIVTKNYHKINSRDIHGKLEEQRPHIIFVVADDLGYNDVGYNGKLHGSVIQTPNIDKLASEGVILDNYYVDQICTPSRAQLMTGRYAHHVINPPRPSYLPVDEVTLAEQLQDIGYVTNAVGKWHLGFYKEECLPTNRGFDTFFGGINYSGFDLHDDTSQTTGPFWDGTGQYSTELFTRKAQDIIQQHAESQTKSLFLYLSYSAVHGPIQVPDRYKEPYTHLIDDELRITMAGMVSSLDEGIGNVTETLKDTGLYDNTIFIFSTDNGGAVQNEASNWPLRGAKATLFEGGIRGVGFVHSPLFPDDVKGTFSHALIHVTDWLPTILTGIAGAVLNVTKPLDGFNVWNSIISMDSSPRTEILHGIDPLSALDIAQPLPIPNAALRMGDWKLLYGFLFADCIHCGWYPPKESNESVVEPKKTFLKTHRLCNVAEDPLEKRDMAIRRPGIVKRMMQRLNVYMEEAVPPFYPPADPDSNPIYRDDVWEPWE